MLEQYIEKSGYKKNFIAEQLGLTYVGLYYKLKENRFTAQEALKLQELLKISDEDFKVIFRNETV